MIQLIAEKRARIGVIGLGYVGLPLIVEFCANGFEGVGFEVDGRQPVREGALVLDGEGSEVGRVTSGGFSPSLERPIAMAYMPPSLGPTVQLEQRGKIFQATVTPMPFVPHRYHR